MSIIEKCPFCDRTEFKDTKSRDNHLYYERKKHGIHSSTQPQQTISRSFDEDDIIERFKIGELSVQDAVNEYQSLWELSNPQPKDGYRDWSERQAKAVDAFREKVIRAKLRVSQSQPVSQPTQSQPIQPRLTVTDLAELRAMELRGPIQFQSFQTPLYEPTPQSEQPIIRTASQNTQPISQSQPTLKNLIANLANGVKNFFSQFNPQFRKQQAPERPINEFGQPASYHRCDTCGGAWINSGEVAIHLSQGHQVIYVPQ